MRFLVVAAAALLVSSPAWAGVKFAVYEGKEAVKEGAGGTKLNVAGVDFWTTGDPPKRYQILGLLTDSRYDWGKDAVGSSGIAKYIKSLGGTGAIVLSESQKSTGAWGYGFSGTFIAGEDEKTVTQMLVVRYLDNPAPAANR